MKHVGQLFENCLTAFFDQSTGELFQFRLLVRGHAEKRTEYCLGGFPLLAAHLMEGIRPGGFEDGENGVCNGCPRLIIHPVNPGVQNLIKKPAGIRQFCFNETVSVHFPAEGVMLKNAEG